MDRRQFLRTSAAASFGLISAPRWALRQFEQKPAPVVAYVTDVQVSAFRTDLGPVEITVARNAAEQKWHFPQTPPRPLLRLLADPRCPYAAYSWRASPGCGIKTVDQPLDVRISAYCDPAQIAIARIVYEGVGDHYITLQDGSVLDYSWDSWDGLFAARWWLPQRPGDGGFRWRRDPRLHPEFNFNGRERIYSMKSWEKPA